MNYEEQAVAGGDADVDEALIGWGGVFGVELGVRAGVIEAGCGFVHGDSVFAKVGGGFGEIELEDEARSWYAGFVRLLGAILVSGCAWAGGWNDNALYAAPRWQVSGEDRLKPDSFRPGR
jgi:hypothetical protein